MTRFVDPIACEILRRFQEKSIVDQPENDDDAIAEAVYRKCATLDGMAEIMAPISGRTLSSFTGSDEDLISTFANLPTDLEDPDSYWKLCNLANAIEECHREDGVQIYTQPLLGTTFSGRLQASIISSKKTDQKIVVLERELFPLVHHFVEIFVSVLPVTIEEGSILYTFEISSILTSLADNMEQISASLANLLHTSLVGGSSIHHGDFFAVFRHRQFATDIEDAVFLLFLGHEYGHLLGRHFSPPSPRDLQDDPPLDEHEDARIQEAQADCLGALSTARCFERVNKPIEMVAAAIGLYVVLPHIVARSVHALHTGEVADPPPSPAYPDWRLRGAMALDAIVNLPEASGKEDVLRTYYDSAINCSLLMSSLAMPSLLAARANGDRPHRRFVWAYD